MTLMEKSKMSIQDKLAKQNEISRQILERELSKLDEHEKQDMRILDTARQRFRSRYKKRGVRAIDSSGSEAIDVRMYETHNPGFCYHCTGAIKESGVESSSSIIENCDDSYEFIKTMLFSNGEVDIEKLLCLHLLAAHTPNNINGRIPVLEKNSSSLLLRADECKSLSGKWNNFLPCYVVQIQENSDECTKKEDLQRETHQMANENKILRDFELSYERYARENSDVVRTLNTHDRMSKVVPRTMEKMSTISPHIYSILGPSHEFRVKRSIAESSARNSFNHSSIESTVQNPRHIPNEEFYLLDDTDLTKISVTRAIDSQEPSRRPSSYGKLDRSITMLRGKSTRNIDDIVKSLNMKNETNRELVTLKSNRRTLGNTVSKNSCEKTNCRKILDDRESSANSFDFAIDNPRGMTIKYRKIVYLNSPVKSFALRAHEYRIVDILVNSQIQALVHSILEVLKLVNPEKVQRVLEMARDIKRIQETFQREDIQTFVESLLDQPIVTFPSSYVVSQATAIDEIDARLEDFLNDELIAMTLDLPTSPGLSLLLEKIRDNIFVDSKTDLDKSDISKIVKPLDEKSSFKPQKTTQEVSPMDSDRIIIKRMTNSQRILVGRMCAALKNRRINNEGWIRERTPLAALITPVLSRESIKMLTRGTIYSKFIETSKLEEEKEEHRASRSQRLTGPVLAKVRRDIAEHETKRRFDFFFAN